MKIKELIHELSKHDNEMEVMATWEGLIIDISSVEEFRDKEFDNGKSTILLDVNI